MMVSISVAYVYRHKEWLLQGKLLLCYKTPKNKFSKRLEAAISEYDFCKNLF